MKYGIKNRCGHTYTYQLFGPGKDRERKIAWLETQLCPTCKRAAETRGFLTTDETEIQKLVGQIWAGYTADPEREQVMRQLRHQLAEGLGTDIRREALRRFLVEQDALAHEETS